MLLRLVYTQVGRRCDARKYLNGRMQALGNLNKRVSLTSETEKSMQSNNMPMQELPWQQGSRAFFTNKLKCRNSISKYSYTVAATPKMESEASDFDKQSVRGFAAEINEAQQPIPRNSEQTFQSRPDAPGISQIQPPVRKFQNGRSKQLSAHLNQSKNRARRKKAVAQNYSPQIQNGSNFQQNNSVPISQPETAMSNASYLRPDFSEPDSSESSYTEAEVELVPMNLVGQNSNSSLEMNGAHLSNAERARLKKQRRMVRNVDFVKKDNFVQRLTSNGEMIFSPVVEPNQERRVNQQNSHPESAHTVEEIVAKFQSLDIKRQLDEENAKRKEFLQRKAALDWSGTKMPKEKVNPAWPQIAVNEIPSPQIVEFRGQELKITPLWLAVHQETENEIARLYMSTTTLDDEVFQKMPEGTLSVLAEKSGLSFTDHCDERNGNWYNFKVGVTGDVAPEENLTFWPNGIWHPSSNRLQKNLRGTIDALEFLANACKESIASHKINLDIIQQEEGLSPEFTYDVLVNRWGESAVQECGFLRPVRR